MISISLATSLSAQDAAKEAPAKEAPAEEAKPEMKPEEMKRNSSYYFGFNTGLDFSRNVSRYGLSEADIESESFTKGFLTALKGDEPEYTDEQLREAMDALGKMLEEREKKLAEANKAAGEKFLAENAKREGVITTESGMQYEILEKGGDLKYEEPKDPEAPQKVFRVKYKGTLIDGTEFDASPPGETVTFDLRVVEGFREAITTMPVGAKWKLFLSPELAYGENRSSAKIGPNSTLIFELELVSIENAPQRPQMPFQIPGQ